MATEKKILTYEKLGYLTGKLADQMDSKDEAILANSKAYADGLADNYDPAGTAETKVNALSNGQVKTNTDAIAKLNGSATTAGSVSKAVADAKSELTTEINKKATKSTTLAGYGITNAYTKTEADTAISTAIANADHLKREIVEALPAIASADTNTIYMVSKTSGSGEQKYDEYMLIGTAFEKIGDSAVDLTNYATKTEVSNAKSEAISSASTDATTKANNALASAKTYADGLSDNYATAEQGTKADSALQKADVTSGTANGTIFVKGTNVAVKGLGSAAYAATTAFDPAGAADAKDTAIAAANKAGDDAQADVDALETKIGTVATGKTVVQMISEAQAAATYNDAAVKEDILANTEAINALEEDVAALQSVSYTDITTEEIDALFA